jgi:hypothetical protein
VLWLELLQGLVVFSLLFSLLVPRGKGEASTSGYSGYGNAKVGFELFRGGVHCSVVPAEERRDMVEGWREVAVVVAMERTS